MPSLKGTLTREGFKPSDHLDLPSEGDLGKVKRTLSTVCADVKVVGESLTGQVLEFETYEGQQLSQVFPIEPLAAPCIESLATQPRPPLPSVSWFGHCEVYDSMIA